MTTPNVHWTPLLRTLCEELTQGGDNHTLLLYGSRADGSADEDSDYDIAAFGPRESAGRDTRKIGGAFLDVFLYPESALSQPGPQWLKLRGSVVLAQRGREADTFLQGLHTVFTQGPPALPADERSARTTWAWKMLARMERGDAEGHYRRAWLLTSLLEDYFALRGLWYEGPKKSLQWLRRHDATACNALEAALQPGAPAPCIREAVCRVVGPPPDSCETEHAGQASAYFAAVAELHTQCGSALQLEPGADEAALASADAALGFALDTGLRQLWQHANGESSGWATVFARPGYFTGYSLLSVAEALAEREGMRQRSPRYAGYEDPRPRDPRVAPGWFQEGWLPFAAFGGATLLLLVDCSPGPGGRRGQIISFVHDPDAMGYVAASMEEFLAGSLQMLQDNLEEFIEPEDE